MPKLSTIGYELLGDTMSEQISPKAYPVEDADAIRSLVERGEGIPAVGRIPDDHEGPYQPSADEMREGIRAMAEVSIHMTRERARFAQDYLNLLFDSGTDEL